MRSILELVVTPFLTHTHVESLTNCFKPKVLVVKSSSLKAGSLLSSKLILKSPRR